MSIIASTYNTGTGLSSSVAEEQLPVVVNDLTINGNLTVIESTILNGPTTVTTDLIVGDTTTTNNLIVNNNTILDNGVGQNNTALFKLPLTNGTTDQILTISDDTTNPILTEWKDASTPINDYVQYNNDSYKLKRNLDLVISDINKLSLNDSIGLNNLQQFKLPANTATSGTGFKLTIIDHTTTPLTTAWTDQYYANNFVRNSEETFRLLRVVDQTEFPINNLSVEGVFGKYGEGFQLPTNTSTAEEQSVLTLFDATTKSTLWQKPFATVAYDASSFTLSSNDPSIVDITNLTLNGQIGKTSQRFSFPSNTSTSPNDGVLHLTSSGLRTTIWKIPFANVAYDGSSYKFSTNNPSIVDISNITLDGQIGKTNQLFSLPSNTATAPSTTTSTSSVLTLSDSITRTTTWTTIPNITSYTNYNATTNILSLINPIGTSTPITALVLSSIGASILQKFALPTNTSTSLSGAVLTLGASNLTSWTTPATAITNYTNYDSTAKTLISNVSGTPTTVIDLVMSGSIGLSTPQKFILPSNSSTASVNSVLTLSNISTKATTWTTISTITNYTNYDSTNKTLISNVSGTPTTVSDLVMSGSIGLSTPQKFILPSNSSTASVNSVLTLSNISTKATTWVSPTSLINNYVNYNSLNNKLASVISGTATDITTIVVDNIGKEAQTFVLPSNTSTATAGSVLRLNNATTKTTDWVVPAMIPTTTETSITTGVATATAATVEMCRASNLTAGTYLITYYVDLDISATTRGFTYRSYGISSSVGSLTGGGGIVGLCVGDSVPYTAPVITGTTPVRYIGSGVCVLTATTTLYLLVRFVYSGTTFNTKGTLRVTKLA
jgi:hypothetical protein